MKLPNTLVKLIKSTIGEPRTGAEIGVFKGITSRVLLEEFPALELWMIDPWQEWPVDSSYRKHKRTGALNTRQWEEIFATAEANVFAESVKGRPRILRQTSEQAADQIADASLDFVFIDGDHTYEMVKQDIKLWLPKVRPDGLICGHDYGGRYRGVMKAVNRIFGRENLILPGSRVWAVDLSK